MLALLHLATAGLTLRDAEAAGKAGDFGPLVELIRTEPGYQERAAFALGELARSGAQDGIVMAGALEPLVKLLKTGSDGKKENAALACIAKILVCIVQCFKRSAAEVNSPALMLKCFES